MVQNSSEVSEYGLDLPAQPYAKNTGQHKAVRHQRTSLHLWMWNPNRFLKEINQLIHNALCCVDRGDHKRIRVGLCQVKLVTEILHTLPVWRHAGQILFQRDLAGKQTAAKLLARIRNRKPFHLKRNLSRPNRLLNGMRHRKLLHFQK